ncbi:homoserine kinase [Motiliproteus sp. SC1-56]|uniref:homoserine kinase n=1 Tax=Motiliproteus sp. SC1-56 TaxID=2799565 RepID=UPI001A903DE5|nr:homoserine kinase [Motiliproteus sp. SC1-56]
MAVYTQLERATLEAFLSDYSLGELARFEGIEGGIENTNYFVDTLQDGQTRRFVLTLFEELSQDEMPFFVELTAYLAERGLPVPAPLKDRHGIALKTLARRPALLLPRFAGRSLVNPGPEHCAQIGEALGRFHVAGRDFFITRQAHRGVFWWRRESHNVAAHLSADDAALLQQEVALFDHLREQSLDLPQGVIHGDLFHDNALFDAGRLSAIIDLYNACTGYLLYDLAIVANDWCIGEDSAFDPQRLQALLQAYNGVRPFTPGEHQAWPILIRTAAMRFWLSRLISQYGLEETRYEGEQVVKDPDVLKRILLNHIARPSHLPTA